MKWKRAIALCSAAALAAPALAQDAGETDQRAEASGDANDTGAAPGWGSTSRSSLSDGSSSFGSGLQLQVDSAFTGSVVVFDPASGGFMEAQSGMSKEDFVAAAAEGGVPLEHLSESEIRAGGDIFVFEDGVLTRMKTGF